MALVARLGGYQPDAQGRWPTPADWLAAHWRAETGKAPDLSDALDLRWLLDGANEILAPTEAARQQALQAWAHWAAAVPAQQPAPLFSVREHELAPLQQAGLNPPQLQVQPWSDERIERYCQAQGQAALWPQIARHAHLRELARNPFNLAAQCQVGQQLGRPARHRAELLCALLQMRLRQPGNQRALAPVLASAPLHGDWVNAPMALDDPFTQALSTLALARQRDGQGLVGPQAQWLAGAGSHGLALLQAAQALHLLSSDSSEDPEEPTRRRTQWRWTHQLWHEFFAARGLVQADSHDLPIDALQPPPLPPIDWAAQQRSWQPLARAPVGPWDECLQLALPQAGLTRVLAWLAALQAAHPPLAARAAVQDLPRLGGHPQAAPLLGPLQAGLRRLSEDPAADLRQRIEAAELAHELGDERYQDLRRDGHAYRLPRQWVRVDVGPHFRLGTAGGPRNECGPDGLPVPCTVTPFDIAPAPVTNAEYALFMADQGYADPQWWPGPAGDWVRGGLDVSAQREAFRQRIGPLLPHLAEAPDISPETKAAVAKALAEGDAATQALINGWAMQGYPEPSGEPVTQPSLWNDPRFNHPSQPVVGVCVFEAQAYALWLAVRSGLAVTLPTEAQWEAAARGPGGRRWPWGDAPADPQDLPREQINHLTTALFRTAPVGLFAGCATPEGVQDLAGNVWEWCSTAYRDGQPLDALSCERALENNADTPRAVRGGAWSGLPRRCRAGYRSRFHPTNRLYDLGFRVVICPI